MNTFLSRFSTLIFVTILFSCSDDSETTKVKERIEYNNIVIYSDLSNRLNHNPNDILIIEQLLDYFKNECVKPGIKINDRSAISFSKLNHFNTTCQSSKIDLTEFENLNEKQKFVNSKSLQSSLIGSISDFKSSVACNYLNKDERGLDVLSLLSLEVDNGSCIKQNEFLLGQYDTTIISYNNHLVLFTDGYLEFSTKQGNPEFYFGDKEIKKIRTFCKANGNISPDSALIKAVELGITPLVNANNQFVNLYILETYDRGFSKKTGTIKNSGIYSDNNILQAVWKNWALKSNFKSFTWKTVSSANSISNNYAKQLIKSP